VHNESESKTELVEIDTRFELVTTQWQDSDEGKKNVDPTGRMKIMNMTEIVDC
jgi:hypothetical protein